MKSVISRDSFCSAEVEIFRAVDCWSKANPTVDIKSILAEIRLELLTIPDLQKLIKNPLIGGDLDGLKYEQG